MMISSLMAGLTLFAVAHTIELGKNDFLLDGEALKIRAGEVHYARIPRQYWRHRLQMLRAMWCNAVGCYMFWNYHERKPGVYKWDGGGGLHAARRHEISGIALWAFGPRVADT